MDCVGIYIIYIELHTHMCEYFIFLDLVCVCAQPVVQEILACRKKTTFLCKKVGSLNLRTT